MGQQAPTSVTRPFIEGNMAPPRSRQQPGVWRLPAKASPLPRRRRRSCRGCSAYAAKLDAHGHDDWRVPTKGELNVLFQNRAAIGGFDVSGSSPAGWYWSSSQSGYFDAWDQRFSDGSQDDDGKDSVSSLRCVR